MHTFRLALVLVLATLLGGTKSVLAGPEAECERLVGEGKQLLAQSEKERDPARASALWAAAAAKFTQAQRMCPWDTEPPFWLGMTHVLSKDVDAYGRAFTALKAIAHPQDPRVPYLQGMFHLRVGRNAALAVRLFESVRARQRTFMPQQLSILLWNAYIEYAFQLVEQAIALGGQGQSGIYNAAKAQLRLAVREGAPSAFRVYAARRNLAQVLWLASEYEESQKVWELLVSLDPTDPVTHYGLATVLADQLKYADAIPHWEKALALRERARINEPTKMEDARMRYGVTLQYANRVREARVELERHTKEHPEDARGWTYLGMLEREHPFRVELESVPSKGEGPPAIAAVAAKVAELLRIPVGSASALVAGLPATLVEGVSVERATEIEEALEPLGATVKLVPDFTKAIAHLEHARRLDSACEEPMRTLLKIYSVEAPDPEKAKQVEAWLANEEQKAIREDVRRKRRIKSADRTEGCK